MATKNYNDALASAIETQTTFQFSEALSFLHDDKGIYNIDESHLHDYKREYPFSNSDSYFFSILRIICAFHNSYGGFLIFGVHDKDRTAGHNKVKVDTEKINRKLRECLSRELKVDLYTHTCASGESQVLIIPVRSAMTPPIYIKKQILEHSPGKIYLRKGSEVLEARGGDLAFLYSDRIGSLLGSNISDNAVPASLPPSPATIQEFVGRFRAIERIFDWITESRDPRLFLWGQGGSGKSTIAYEAASLIAESGRVLKNRSGNSIERVLYISGKATYLDPYSGKIKEVSKSDFKSALDIFKAILHLADWASLDEIESYNNDESIKAIEDLLDIESLFIIIDDIDTLTTANIDSGMEELLFILSRCKSGTKILYTLRNFPSFAPNAAIEVPGLDKEEFNQFVDLCCQKFSVEVPTGENKSKIEIQSEGRPLAIETMIGMRRITSSYTEAFQRWKDNSSEARDYLFNREYQQLSSDGRSKYLLAALSVFGSPQSFETLRNVLQFSAEQLQDAISETRDMFLTISSGKNNGDIYSIGAATKLFILEISQQLDIYATIEARVNNFKSKLASCPAAYIPIMDRASRALQRNAAIDAVNILTKEDFPPAFREHPDIKALLGQAYSKIKPPKIHEARKCFESAFALGHRQHRMYIDWLELEKENGTEIINGIRICKKITEDEDFDQRTKATFYGRLARLQALRARDAQMSAPQEASILRRESTLSNIRAFVISKSIESKKFLSLREKAVESINITLRSALREDDFDSFFDLIEEILNENCDLNEFAETIAGRVSEIETRRPKKWRPILARIHRIDSGLRAFPESRISQTKISVIREALKQLIRNAESSSRQ